MNFGQLIEKMMLFMYKNINLSPGEIIVPYSVYKNLQEFLYNVQKDAFYVKEYK
jgi:hypothetical protein